MIGFCQFCIWFIERVKQALLKLSQGEFKHKYFNLGQLLRLNFKSLNALEQEFILSVVDHQACIVYFRMITLHIMYFLIKWIWSYSIEWKNTLLCWWDWIKCSTLGHEKWSSATELLLLLNKLIINEFRNISYYKLIDRFCCKTTSIWDY